MGIQYTGDKKDPVMNRGIELRPVIASYLGKSYRAIKDYLDSRVLEEVVKAVISPSRRADFDQEICDELIEMHVFIEVEGCIRLNTAVFLEDDLERITTFSAGYARDLAVQIAREMDPLKNEHPVVINFMVGILGLVQSLGHALREAKIAIDWWNYTGKYAQSKVDFDQVCEAGAAAGPDLLNKTVLRGDRYTAVFTGPGGDTYPIRQETASEPGNYTDYIYQVNKFLTDSYAMLLTGQVDHPALRAAARQAGLFKNGEPETVVITSPMLEKYLPEIQNISSTVKETFTTKYASIRYLLQTTRCGKQGVPPENMLLHLGRYLRRAVARELYTSGVFTDRVPETGVITIFYENNIGILNELFR